MSGFTSKQIANPHNLSNTPQKRSIIKYLGFMLLLGCIIIGGLRGVEKGFGLLQEHIGKITKSSISFIGSTIGTQVEEDEMGQISFLIAGIGGKGHRGEYNSDTLLVASYNPKNKAVTFIGIPRDLYVNIDTNRNGRINAVIGAQITRGNTLTGAMQTLTNKISSIVGIELNHYILVDFEGFEKMIDTLGGITVNVPNKLVDYNYPADEYKVMTLTIESGLQTMNGDLALKYARSRYSTSDFDRSLRQQQIIEGVIKKFISGGGIFKINELYSDFQNTIITNLSLSQMIGLSKYLDKINHYYSFVLQSECNSYFKLTHSGCFLYAPNRNAFGGAAVLLPVGATASNISNYASIQKFTDYVINNQKFLIENPRILLWNGIDKNYLQPGQSLNGATSPLATTLVEHGFNIQAIGNNMIKSTGSIIYQLNTGSFDTSITLLQGFVTASPAMIDATTLSGTVFSGNNELELTTELASEYDLIVVLGNDYLSK